MPVADQSIIAPGVVDTKSPMKKSTVAWLFLFVILLTMAGYYGPRMMKANSKDPSQEPVKAAPPTKGTEKAIENELADAERRAAIAAKEAAESKPRRENAPSPSPIPLPIKTSLKSVDQVSAQEPGPDGVEHEAAGRISKSIVVDGIAPEHPVDQSSASTSNRNTDRQTTSESRSERSDELLKLARANLGATAKNARELDREWLQEFKELKPTPSLRPKRVANPYTLIQGKIIPAVLGKALNSDLPGDITAFTTIDIYDSLSSNYCLIPKGSMLVGEYSNRVRAGQARLMFAFSRIVLPNGMSFDLPGNKGQDQMGASGVGGDVNNHYFQRYSSALLIAFLADKAEQGRSSSSGTVVSSAAGPTTAAGTVLAEVARDDLARNKDIQPTITVQAGTRINVQVSADMEFPSQYPRCKVN